MVPPHTGTHSGIGARMSDLTDVTRKLVAVFAADVEGMVEPDGPPGGTTRFLSRNRQAGKGEFLCCDSSVGWLLL